RDRLPDAERRAVAQRAGVPGNLSAGSLQNLPSKRKKIQFLLPAGNPRPSGPGRNTQNRPGRTAWSGGLAYRQLFHGPASAIPGKNLLGNPLFHLLSSSSPLRRRRGRCGATGIDDHGPGTGATYLRLPLAESGSRSVAVDP